MAEARFFSWTPDDVPAVIIPTDTETGYDRIRSVYAPRGNVPALDQLIALAKAHDVRSIVVERRYIDADYRSEHARFYSTTFQRYPSVAHRLHFFTTRVPDSLQELNQFQDNYVGYSVMRPLDTAPVGRTMIAPPPEVEARWCLATDTVHLLGWNLYIEAVPFMSQDEQYLRCAHAAEWMVLYHAHLFHGLPRRLPADVYDEALGGEVVDRQLPSMGLSVGQMLNSLHQFGLSPSRLTLPSTREESISVDPELSLPGIICRYVNSQMPPIVLSESHAWVIAGYAIEGEGHAHDHVVFYRHDDAAGPYIRVKDPWNEPKEQHQPWLLVLPPLPKKCYLTAERAEAVAIVIFQAVGAALERATTEKDTDFPGFGSGAIDDWLGFRTYGISSTLFKDQLRDRGMPEPIAQLYRLANWPKYIWVTEVQDRKRRDGKSGAVLGEVILDGTAHHFTDFDDPAPLLAMHVAGYAMRKSPEFGNLREVKDQPWNYYESGCPAPLRSVAIRPTGGD